MRILRRLLRYLMMAIAVIMVVGQLGSHTSGLEDAEADRLPHDKLTGWKGDFWKRLDPPNDPFTLARDKTPTSVPSSSNTGRRRTRVWRISRSASRTSASTSHA